MFEEPVSYSKIENLNLISDENATVEQGEQRDNNEGFSFRKRVIMTATALIILAASYANSLIPRPVKLWIYNYSTGSYESKHLVTVPAQRVILSAEDGTAIYTAYTVPAGYTYNNGKTEGQKTVTEVRALKSGETPKAYIVQDLAEPMPAPAPSSTARVYK